YLRKSYKQREIFFYEIRNHYNEQIKKIDYENFNNDWIERTALLIFLNKTCFNGLFRQNKNGEFNVPFGGYENPKIADENNICAVNKALIDTEIFCLDFSSALDMIDKNSFVYLDPPYRPLNKTSSFTDYSKEGFTDTDQKRLSDFYKRADKKGAYLMLSNSDSKDNFFNNLYSEYNIQRVLANRMINCNGNGRGKITELIITNY
ncbi:MAG TPA: Dam family site-specific DNA-(adenine-N6)-methyltransferase, partial [bacterium]|nr:Dam family site-specific DNA-(adenine-N6)-methyltransferase [bacterium]